MKNAKDFYEAYDIPHPNKLLPREEQMFEALNNTQKDIQVQARNKTEENKQLREELLIFNVQKLSIAGGCVVLAVSIVLSIIGAIADSEKRTLHRENELLKKENIYLKNQEVGKLAIENNKLRIENAEQKAELEQYNCLWKACIK